ncbi:hypothetical protein NW756_005884 [Fusarium oxysporum]|nr:hypothetical protein NW763_002701 [Fusarium oxysporum]KAJ4066804.1 hypothetical protein NW753_001884 [Fusarium oxysporum]KAJ4091095.1 hypothetical protein NW769_013057 [Fusarium oxysporum]KAJ4091679.1 hypothetical protein NW756_005884 [Fusarium oxysporum]KAJ4215167.1 hypothetical protein NW760_014516 [Fusarium oxysporum]
MAACTTCNKEEPAVQLRRCAKCSTTPYCSRECQKADWKAHKKICGKQADSFANANVHDPDEMSQSPKKGLEKSVPNPFTRLDNGTYLYNRPEKDVYRLLIDTYRLLSTAALQTGFGVFNVSYDKHQFEEEYFLHGGRQRSSRSVRY